MGEETDNWGYEEDKPAYGISGIGKTKFWEFDETKRILYLNPDVYEKIDMDKTNQGIPEDGTTFDIGYAVLPKVKEIRELPLEKRCIQPSTLETV